MELKTLYDTWERFKGLLRRCSHHGLPTWLQVQMFYDGLNHATRQMINPIVGGILNNKTLEVTQELFKEMAMNSYKWHSSKAKPNSPTYMFFVNAIIALAIQVETLSKKIEGLLVIK